MSVWASGVWGSGVWASGVWAEDATNCVWANGVWASGFWANGVWYCSGITPTPTPTPTPRRGGDDRPPGWSKKRAKLKLDREREFTEQIRDLYRELTGDPRTAEWAHYFRAEQAALRRKHLRALAEEAEEASEREALAEALETALIADGTATQGDVDRLRLDQIAALYTDRTLLDRRAQRALAYAERSRTELATRLALRELQRQQEDEELAVLLVLAID